MELALSDIFDNKVIATDGDPDHESSLSIKV